MASRLEDVIDRGPAASRPLATSVAPGTLYYSTDTATTDRSNGTIWETYSDTSGGAGANVTTIIALPGYDGIDGEDGIPGLPGASGGQGLTGATGATGATGKVASPAYPFFPDLEEPIIEPSIPIPGPPGAAGPAGSGSGDVVGPVSAVDVEIAIYNGVTGKIIKTSGLFITDLAGTAYLQFGGKTLAFPALKNFGAVLQVRLADNSDYGSITAKDVVAEGTLYARYPGGGGLVILDPTADAAVTRQSYITFQTAGTPRWYMGMSANGNTGNFDLYNNIAGHHVIAINKTTSLTDILKGLKVTGNIELTANLTLPDNVTQIFNPGADNAGINVGSLAGDPATPDNGDVWYDSTANELTARINGVNVVLGAGASVAQKTRQIGIVVDGGGSVLTTGLKGFKSFPVAGTITAVRLLADQSGSIVIDIWKDTYANFPPTVADTITASAKPTITTAVKSEDTTLTGWTTAVAAGDIFAFNIDSVTTIQRIILELTIVVT